MSERIDKPDKAIFDILPPWINYVALDADGAWFGYHNEPFLQEGADMMWCGDVPMLIPLEYIPKWEGDWKDSLIGRDEE